MYYVVVLWLCLKEVQTIGNTQISILLLCFLYLFVERKITMNEKRKKKFQTMCRPIIV